MKTMKSMVLPLIGVLLISAPIESANKVKKPFSDCSFETPTSITVMIHENSAAMIAHINTLITNGVGVNAGDELSGISVFDPNTKVHTIHMLRPRSIMDKQRIQTLGHEVLHVYCGKWHPPYFEEEE